MIPRYMIFWGLWINNIETKIIADQLIGAIRLADLYGEFIGFTPRFISGFEGVEKKPDELVLHWKSDVTVNPDWEILIGKLIFLISPKSKITFIKHSENG